MSFVTQYDKEKEEFVGFPMLLSNFVRVTPEATEDSLPEGWYFYNKTTSQPNVEIPSPYYNFELQVLVEGNTITEKWVSSEMTAEEKLAKQNQAKDRWAQNPDLADFSTWVFDENICEFKPPLECPSDGIMYGLHKAGVDKKYWWDNALEVWVEVTAELKAELDKKQNKMPLTKLQFKPGTNKVTRNK